MKAPFTVPTRRRTSPEERLGEEAGMRREEGGSWILLRARRGRKVAVSVLEWYSVTHDRPSREPRTQRTTREAMGTLDLLNTRRLELLEASVWSQIQGMVSPVFKERFGVTVLSDRGSVRI